MRFYLLAIALMAALLSPFWSSASSCADDFTPGRGSFYISDQILNTVNKFKVSNGNFQEVLITGMLPHPITPNGIVVNPISSPKLMVAFQNANTPFNGEIRVFDEATGAFKFALVRDIDPGAPCAPFGILLYNNLLLVADEGGCGPGDGAVEAFDTTTTPATFMQNLDTTGYSHSFFHPFGMVIGPDGKLYVANRPLPHQDGIGDVVRFDLQTMTFDRRFVIGATCGCNLDHPNGVVFGPDGRLYVSSSRPEGSNVPSNDTDKILIFAGTTGSFVDKIDLDRPGGQRSAALGLLFGPQGLCFTRRSPSSTIRETPLGSGRCAAIMWRARCSTIWCRRTRRSNCPTLFTFGGTNPATLAYEK